jgi:hypothetical protein
LSAKISAAERDSICLIFFFSQNCKNLREIKFLNSVFYFKLN